ncbi:hypothetical protein TSUD_136090 [Trifolium subterraneum]|uniref:Uncharacterized protein n=1 Tax=Trifolium subterraneum TaxID=3900 RepID=A0A2Z6P6P6_TRISU|nr:hypothetical protein TSUD_136090 [Trifolium subterraneum]
MTVTVEDREIMGSWASRHGQESRPSGLVLMGKLGLTLAPSSTRLSGGEVVIMGEISVGNRYHSWRTFRTSYALYERLTNAELRFLERVMFLKDDLIEDGHFIETAENEHHLHHVLVSDLFDKTWHLKESMRVHVELMNLAFTEEDAVTHRMKVLEEELKVLSKKKEELHVSNKDDISALLFKRRELARLEIKTKTLGESLKKINDDLTTSKKYKRALEDMQTMALDAIPNV